jgi:phosphoribosylformimino-5-aminoimidazole carboxamide ribotide isomerase
MFEVFISLDLLGGRVVRLEKGDVSRVKIYSSDPFSKAVEILEQGFKMIHIVDLEEATQNKSIGDQAVRLAKHIKDLGGMVSVGGGIRRKTDVERILDADVDRIVIGTAIYRGLIPIDWLLDNAGERTVVSIDYRSGRIAINGWKNSIDLAPNTAIERFTDMGFRLFLMTNIDLDGSLRGIKQDVLENIDRRYRGRIIVSGGVRDISDIAAVKKTGYRGVIIGRAYYEGLINIKEVLEVLKQWL